MSQKQTTVEIMSEQVADAVQKAGMALMTMAAVAGMIELPDKMTSRAVLPMQPSFATATENQNQINPLRREREEEAGVHYVSYAAVQRTPGRSSKQ